MPQIEVGGLDLLIARIWHPWETPGIGQIFLFSKPVVVVAARNHPLAQSKALAWSNVANLRWIPPQANSVARQAVDALFAANGLTPPTNTIASLSLALNLELLRQMTTLGLMPQWLAQAQPARGELSILPLDTLGLPSKARCFRRADQIT